MDVQLHADGLDELRGEWAALFESDDRATPFVSPAWVLACWRHYGEGARPWVVAVRRDGRLTGLALLALRRGRAVRTLKVLGEELGDYWSVLALPAERDAVVDAVAAELRRRRDWDELLLRRLRQDSGLAVSLDRAGLRAMQRPGAPCPGVPLPESFDDYLATLPSGHRSNLRRHLKRLDEGELALRSVTDPGELPDAVERWHALRLRQWAEQGRRLHPLQSDECFPHFIRDVLAELVPSSRALLWELHADDRLVGSYLNFTDERAFYWYLGGYEPEAAALGIGKIVVGEGIRSSIAAGRRYFDFMIGAEPYKYWFGASDQHIETLRVRRRNARTLLRRLL